MTLEEIEYMLERAEDRHDLDAFNFWWSEREKKKRELQKQTEDTKGDVN